MATHQAPLSLVEGNPVGEGTTRRGTATPVHTQGSNRQSLAAPALAGGFFTTSTDWEAEMLLVGQHLWLMIF